MLRYLPLLCMFAATPVLASPEQDSAAVALCKAALAEKAPGAAVQFQRGAFKSRSAKLDFTVRTAEGARQTAQCRVSHKDAKVTDLTIS